MPITGQQMTYPILIRFAKAGLMRFVGHLDWLGLQQAMFLRAGLRIVTGEGPTHRLKIKTSPPTPVGVASLTELTYLLLAQPLYPEEVKRRLSSQIPEGIEVVAVKDAGHLARKNPFAAIEATKYTFELGEGVTDSKTSDVIAALEKIRSDDPPDASEVEDVGAFWGRIIEIEKSETQTALIARQLEGNTFHAAKCAAFLEKSLALPHYPKFTKLDYYRLTPSRRRLFV